jgi:tetratricopeptide (TPR) repeat protein
MTKIYCGWCGSANSVGARFCRMCGGELAAQSGPLAAPPVGAAGGKGSGRLRPPYAGPYAGEASAAPQGADFTRVEWEEEEEDESDRELEVQEKVAVENLKRLRSSGPLIIEEAMKNKEQMNEIIGQAVEGQPASPSEVTEAEPPPGLHQTAPETGMSATARPGEGGAGEVGRVRVSQVIRLSQSGAQGVTGGLRPSGTGGPSGQSSTGGRTGRVAGGATGRLTGSPTPPGGTTGPTGSLPNPGGPSQVLADASGLQTGTTVGMSLRIGLILLLLFVSTAGYLIFRERILGASGGRADVRELRSPQELSDEAVREGQQAGSQGNIDGAITHYQRALQLTPTSPAALFLLAQAYGQAGRTDESMTTYADLLRVAPENLEARLQIATIYQGRNDWAAAYREYQRIIALDQNSLQATLALEAIETHEAAQAGNEAVRQAAARKRVNRVVLPVLPTPAIGQQELSLHPPGLTPGLTGADQARPTARLEVGQAVEPPDPGAVATARKELGLRYLNIREYRAAIKEFLIALRMAPEDKDIYYFLASSYHGLQQFAEAHDYYKRVDRGRYVEVAQSGARRTEKAAADYRRRMSLAGND